MLKLNRRRPSVFRKLNDKDHANKTTFTTKQHIYITNATLHVSTHAGSSTGVNVSKDGG